MWQDWTNGVLGLAVVGMAIYGFGTMGATLGWGLGIVGAIIAAVGFWGALSAQEGSTSMLHA